MFHYMLSGQVFLWPQRLPQKQPLRDSLVQSRQCYYVSYTAAHDIVSLEMLQVTELLKNVPLCCGNVHVVCRSPTCLCVDLNSCSFKPSTDLLFCHVQLACAAGPIT